MNNLPSSSSVMVKCFTEADFDLSSKDKIKLQKMRVPIPENEERRLQVLREASILDSNETDAIYDRFTNLAARIFKAPICLVSLIDVDRQWFKSRVGLEGNQTIRDHAFCTYVVLEDSPDVMVVLDARKDDRFHDNPLVTGPPYIKFYAGAAIYLAGFKIGSFCIIDSEPKAAFSLNDQLNLMDISSMVSNLIEARRLKNLDTENDNAKLSMNILYNLKCPLQICERARSDVAIAYKNYNDALLEKQKNEILPIINSSVENLMISINQLKQLIESSIALAQNFVSFSSHTENLLIQNDIKPVSNKFLAMEGINMLDLFSQIRKDLDFNGAVDVKWKIEKRQFETSDIHISYPDIIKINFFSVFMSLLREAKDFSIRIRFREEESDVDNDNKVSEDDDDPIVSEWIEKGFAIIKGDLEISMILSKEGNSSSGSGSSNVGVTEEEKVKWMSYEQIDSHTINHLLKSIKGSYQVRASRDLVSNEVKDNTSTTATTTTTHMLLFPMLIPYESGKVKAKPKRNEATRSSEISIGSSMSHSNSISGRLRVLVIEDSTSLQKILKTWLKRNGCDVTICGNGKEGYDKLTTDKFDMVLLDFLMPVMLGITCLTNYYKWRTKDNLEPDTTLVIGLSACATESEQLEAFQLGMHFYCHKPTNTEFLTIALAACRNNSVIDDITLEIFSNSQHIKNGIKYPPN